MTFDLYADLAQEQACPTGASLPEGLVSGFVDGCTEWSVRGNDRRNEARRRYIQRAQAERLQLPDALSAPLTPNVSAPLLSDWLGLEVSFKLETPWYSKDDRPFHVLDNPVRKDRVFGVPYMSAASWKGLLRWACRMQAGLREHLEVHRGSSDLWKDPGWILHLFGNEKREETTFQQGALVFYPSWFYQIGFEVINPHSREKKAGIHPIYYEVVPPGANGTLYLLYAPWPGMKDPRGLDRKEAIKRLLEAIEQLLKTYGISAKRTVGWGTAQIQEWKAYRKDTSPATAPSGTDLWNTIGAWFESGGTA
ncbi:MAG TPA: RAMP superfamily CRISPR-associated protein [Burkholderiales bacterium]|nr:RAMP superfamily CRISPR-associated protein [Burkholderiales bacterium]